MDPAFGFAPNLVLRSSTSEYQAALQGQTAPVKPSTFINGVAWLADQPLSEHSVWA